jgi:hypothetical protein
MPAVRLVVAAVCVLLASAGARAADPLAQNAALHYWQAVALMPGDRSLDKLTEDEQTRIDEPQTAPIDDVTRSAVKKHTRALVQLHRGAELPNCAWSINNDLSRDCSPLVPHVWKTRDVALAALLRARVRFADGEPLRAVDDLVAVVRLARHLNVNGDRVSMLAGWRLEQRAIDVFAANLWSVTDRGVVREAAAKWAKLPPARPLVEVLAQDRDETVSWLYRHSIRDPDDVPDTEHEPVGRFVTLGFYTGEQTLHEAAAAFCLLFAKHYDRFVALAALPVDKVEKAEKELVASLKTINLMLLVLRPDEQIVRVFTAQLRPAAGNLRFTEAEMQTRRAMLRAALAIAGGGGDRLKEHPDPFGGVPFEVRPVDGGYELKSGLSKVIGRPVVLVLRTSRPQK